MIVFFGSISYKELTIMVTIFFRGSILYWLFLNLCMERRLWDKAAVSQVPLKFWNEIIQIALRPVEALRDAVQSYKVYRNLQPIYWLCHFTPLIRISIILCFVFRIQKPVQASDRKSMRWRCRSSGPIALKAEMQRSAYCSGEYINIRTRLENNSDKTMKLRVKLLQVQWSFFWVVGGFSNRNEWLM